MKDKILAADKDHQRVLAVRTQSNNAQFKEQEEILIDIQTDLKVTMRVEFENAIENLENRLSQRLNDLEGSDEESPMKINDPSEQSDDNPSAAVSKVMSQQQEVEVEPTSADASPMSTRPLVLTPTANAGFTCVQDIMSEHTDNLIPSVSGQRIPIELNVNPVKNRNVQA